MAAKRKVASGTDARVSSYFANTIFERLKAQKLQVVLQKVFPTRRVEQRGAGRLLMNCVAPGHPDRTPSLEILTTANLALCHSCGFRTRSLLELFSVGAGLSYAEGLTQIQAATGVKLVTDKLAKQLEEQDIHQVATKLFGAICSEFLRRATMYGFDGAAVPQEDAAIYSPALLHSVQPVLDWLYKKRALNRTYGAYLPYGIMPTPAAFEELSVLLLDDQVARATQAYSEITTAFNKERRALILAKLKAMFSSVPAEYSLSVTFHTGYSATLAGRIRCRRVIISQGTDNAFWNMAGFAENDPIGYLNLMNGSAGSRREKAKSIRLIMVESEISALVMQQYIYESGIPDTVVVASAGSNNTTDMLHTAGFDSVDLLMDHPDPAIGKGEDQLRMKLQTALHIQPRVFDKWDDLSRGNITVKDPDDVVQMYGWDHLREYLFEHPDAFTPVAQWASERAIEEADRIHDSNILARQNAAAEYGRCVQHPTLLAAFVTRVSAALALPPGPLRAAIVQLKDDESGLISRVIETLKAEFAILYRDDTAKGHVVVLFHRQNRRYVHVPVADGPSIITALSNVLGEMYQYFCTNVGLPIEDQDTTSPTAIRDGQRFVGDYLRIAFQEIYCGVLSKSECDVIGPGIHYYPGEEGSTKSIIRIHNGQRWFKATIDSTNDELTYEELSAPTDGQVLFDDSDRCWSTVLTSDEALAEASKMDLDVVRAAFRQVLDLIDRGWRFRHQREDALFFTAALFMFAAGDAFDIKIIMRIIGESNSGKSTLLSLLCRGQVPELTLCENATYMTSYTNASIYQTFNRARTTMVLEEASQDPTVSTHKTVQMDDINETLRQIIYAGGIQITRATPQGRPITYKLFTNVAMTTITEPRDIQEANRSYMIETVREDNRIDPTLAIRRMVTPQAYNQLRRTVQLGLLRYFPRLRQKQQELYDELNVKAIATYTAHSRFLRNFAPIGAVLDLMGYDAMAEIRRMVEAKRERQLSQAANSASRLLVDRILRSAVVPLPGGSSRMAMTTPLQCITAPGGYEMLNGANVGVVLDPNKWLLVFDHVALMSTGGAGARINEVTRQTPHQVKATIDQHPDIVPSRRYKELGIAGLLAQVYSTALEHEVSVIDMSRTRKAILEAAQLYSGIPITANASAPGGVVIAGTGTDNKDNL